MWEIIKYSLILDNLNMDTIPNLKVVKEMAEEINSEYDLSPRLDRYKTLNPDLLEFAVANGLSEEDAPYPLFISDYIVTSSEVPSGLSDEERRLSIIKSFVKGKERNSDVDKLMRIFYLAHKVKQAFRRNDYFLAGRGLGRNPSLVILKDIFVTPYLVTCKEILGDGDQLWEMGILYSAVKHTLPSEELQKVRGDLSYTWEQMNEYSDILEVEQNDTLTIPHKIDTQVLLIDRMKLPRISMYNIARSAEEEEKSVVTRFLDYLDATDKTRSLVYLNSKILGSDENIILVRNPMAKGKPVIFLKTKADELNVSQVMSILNLHGGEDWSSVEVRKRQVSWTETVESEEEVDVEREVTEVVNKEVTEMTEVEVEEKPKGGFLRRLFGWMKGTPGKVKKTVPVKKNVPTKVKKKVKGKENRKVSKKVKHSDDIAEIIPPFVAEAVSTLALGDLNLFQIWDTVRDSNYVVIGAVESNFKDNTTTLQIDEKVGGPEEFAAILDGLDDVVESMVKYFFNLDVDILPNDILFVKSDEKGEQNYYISFDGNEERLLGTIAVTFQKTSIGFAKEEGEDDVINRRTMKMRTRQLMSSREHTPFDTSVERILGGTLSSKAQTAHLEKAILNLH